MKFNGILIILLSVVMVSLFGVGCCCGGDSDFDFDDLEDFGEDYEETETKDKPEEIVIPDIPDTGGFETQTGYLSGPGSEQEFGLYANKDPLELTFSWDSGLDPYCHVRGRDHNDLGKFRLADGEIIELTGGGQFYITVGAYHGSGNWTCTYSN
jgi:hypothetical protein